MQPPPSRRPEPSEYASYYESYISLVTEDDVLAALELQVAEMLDLLAAVGEQEAKRRHAPYTWSVKEVVGHMVDGERIFAARALRFARYDPTELPGFDENDYVRRARFDSQTLRELVEEFGLVRRSNLCLFRGLDAAAWRQTGVANGATVSVRAIAFIMVGHVRHHLAILRKRLVNAG